MGIARGTASGLGAVIAGVYGLQFGGYIGFVGGAMIGTIATDFFLYVLGFHIEAGPFIGISKGIAASIGGVVGLFVLGGLPGLMLSTLVGAIAGDVLHA